jgi:hypothetical protein
MDLSETTFHTIRLELFYGNDPQAFTSKYYYHKKQWKRLSTEERVSEPVTYFYQLKSRRKKFEMKSTLNDNNHSFPTNSKIDVHYHVRNPMNTEYSYCVINISLPKCQHSELDAKNANICLMILKPKE